MNCRFLLKCGGGSRQLSLDQVQCRVVTLGGFGVCRSLGRGGAFGVVALDGGLFRTTSFATKMAPRWLKIRRGRRVTLLPVSHSIPFPLERLLANGDTDKRVDSPRKDPEEKGCVFLDGESEIEHGPYWGLFYV